jgi:alpha-D-ribose 1-methylphosphonate 5-triphosphate diphosphatase
MELSVFSMENRLLAHGITSIFHSFSFIDGGSAVRSRNNIGEYIDNLTSLRTHGVIRHFLHGRYEVSEPVFTDLVVRFLERGVLDLVSFMDHTPGQGQYRTTTYLEKYMRQHRDMSETEVKAHIAERISRRDGAAIDSAIDFAIDRIAATARRCGVPMASHDDDSAAKVAAMRSRGVSISEFPVERAVARAAREAGLHVAVGAPNVVRGGSNSGNMRAIDAILDGSADILCSDYMPPALLHSVFALADDHGVPLHGAVAMASRNPALAAGKNTLGAVERGLAGDLILVSRNNGLVSVYCVLVGGRIVYARNRYAETMVRAAAEAV